MPEVKSVHFHYDRHSKSKRESLALTDQEVVVKINRHNGSLSKGRITKNILEQSDPFEEIYSGADC